jgi:Zn-finger nucleic acid-binding protein
MANCINCGAALPAHSVECMYCKTRQDVDLHLIHQYTVVTPETERICPRCNKPMQTVDIKVGEKFLIERCLSCMGLFFDPGELEALIDKSVSNVYCIDYAQLQVLKQSKRSQDYPVTYIKCPVCQKLMNRINYGAQSGVIVDTCKNHGVWLDGGELRQLMEWTKAGGRLYQQEKEKEVQKIKEMDEIINRSFQGGSFGASTPYGDGNSRFSGGIGGVGNEDPFEDIVVVLKKFVKGLFR